ncbi:hypothetical protein G3O06_05505 [Burkholderia sp. Ac-20345]|uniref:hypothetical protein n=1 Tax=Burkholderia sp. Ac-20345 TaxID=2703891 RepID=UPI00197C3C93|nr:hypothetical protein [Burkholderia sp. Ac-20345]MBN3777026.1 hypothetical protein [Burkholderia sp. Ac-20345]
MTLPIEPQKRVRRIHVANDTGERSRCRYTSRPSVRATFVPLAEFMALPKEARCVECERKAKATNGGAVPAI